jgi:LacI family transcriptional regulator
MNDGPMPARTNLTTECVRVMRMRIDAGEWGEFLPGERRLADLLQVGRDTVRHALRELETGKIIASTASGSRRRILAAPSADTPESGTRSLKIGILSPHRLERLPQPMLFEVDQIRTALAAKNGTLRLFSPPWYDQKNPEQRLEQLTREESCSGWILYRSSMAVQQWFEKSRLPCLVRGYPQPGVTLPHLDVDWRATAHHAAAHLWRLGHRRIAVIAPQEALGGVAAAVNGIMEFPEEGFQPMKIIEDGTVEGIIRTLTRALTIKDAPTALVATRPRQAATALTWLASRGIRVPEHLSLITLASEPFLEFLVPKLTGYRVNPDATAKLVTRRLERLTGGGQSSGTNPWIVPDFEKGASAASPPAGK